MPRSAETKMPAPIFGQPVFNETTQTADPGGFLVPFQNDDATYKQIEKLLTKDVVSFDKSRVEDDQLFTLADAYGPQGQSIVDQIEKAESIVFHAAGDSGATTSKKYQSEITVADQMTADALTQEVDDRPSFFLHLGDVVYDFGQADYYYDQFYDPFRNYPAPIFAIAGNHDSFIVPGTAEADEPLVTFARNFCSSTVAITPEAKSLHRTAMTQPGVYYALDAPFVRLICLFSNALEDPGVISSARGKYKNVPDYQLDFLKTQLGKIAKDKYKGAVLIAVHHPPFSFSPKNGSSTGNHGSSTEMLSEIDAICKQEKVYPHAIISGHAHNYQRYTRTFTFGGKEIDVPYIISGSAGHAVNALTRAKRGQPSQEPKNGSDVSYMDHKSVFGKTTLVLEKYDDETSGYLRISADKTHLRLAFHEATEGSILQSRYDLVTVDIATHELAAN
jgi:Calcineurin-like phosphoesterase